MIEYRISSFCDMGGCVEVGHAPDGSVVVRDAKDPSRAIALSFDRGEWATFLAGVRNGDFDAL